MLIFSSPINLAQTSLAYLAKVQLLLNAPSASKAEKRFTIAEVERLLKDLDGAVTLFEQQAKFKTRVLSNLELAFWLLTLVLLFIELKFIFQPMELQITAAINKYQQQKLRAEQISTYKERFIARASHEFRTPLQGLVDSIEQLQLLEFQQALQKQAKYCASRIVSMLDELYELQQFNTGQWQLKFIKRNLITTLESAITPFQFSCDNKQLKFEIKLSPELDRYTEFDHLRLQQIITELLSNAIKFTSTGQVSISVSYQDGHIKIVVADSGVGFAQCYPYLNHHSIEQGNDFQGLQTGLARVQHIVSAMQGGIEFKDVIPHGAQIKIRLPLSKAALLTKQGNLPAQLHCLIVEDNLLNATILSRILTELNYTVEVAENGLIATQKIAESEFNVIFMDLNMPVMDGFQAIDIIRQELNSTVPIIVITANTAPSDLERTYELGSNVHVYKPFSVADIKKALMNVFNEG
ncbi:MAG: signal transduction histidine kinase/CheY-like chemotaxis protein [Pseudoalteromonas rhizosphaerae]|uniref:histidine kinase n=1 Tax=Pseudoalteromonas neustonica TaxID=1840331 RepID=A0ABY3FCK7_9GAMM|nr:response regulator [Pseudoalteromonas neustonica]TVU82812.1 response regulator [Pseudoalteromonas neustonica]